MTRDETDAHRRVIFSCPPHQTCAVPAKRDDPVRPAAVAAEAPRAYDTDHALRAARASVGGADASSGATSPATGGLSSEIAHARRGGLESGTGQGRHTLFCTPVHIFCLPAENRRAPRQPPTSRHRSSMSRILDSNLYSV